MNNLDEISAALTDAGFDGSKWLKRYAAIFSGVQLHGATVLDVGAGAGWASFYAAAAGAKSVAAIEPQLDGSRSDMLEQFHRLRDRLGYPVEMFVGTFEDYPLTQRFDVVVVNNTINHFSENSCIHLHCDPRAKEAYQPIFAKLAAATGGTLLLTDCSNRNFFGDLGLRSPVAPTIEWEKHQPPEIWAELLAEHGFQDPAISWLPVIPLGLAGRMICASKLGAYFLNSHFRMTMAMRQPRAQIAA